MEAERALAFLIGMMLIPLLCALYLTPAVIAWQRGHHNRVAIFATNLLLGWMILGWIAALIWSLTAVDSRRLQHP